jgi:UDP-glucose 4-epimerase
MKILVTGGAGFIGSHVVDAYIAAGHTVTVVDNLSSGSRSNINADARLIVADIRHPSLLDVFASERPEIVSHLAAQISVRVSITDPLHDANVNVLGTINVLEAARRAGVRKIIYSSSGGAAYGEPHYVPCDEDHPIEPLSPYGVTKYAAEHYLALYRRLYGYDTTVLRYPNVYGPRQDPYGEGGVVAIFTAQMLRNEPVTIYGTGDQERDFVMVADIAAANLAALDRGGGEIVNLGSGKGTSVGEVYRLLAAILNYGQSPLYRPARAGEVFKISLTNERASRLLGWKPMIALPDGLRMTAEAIRLQISGSH